MRFSLKFVFAIVFVAAMCAYNYPVTTKANVDYTYPGRLSADPCFCCRHEGDRVKLAAPLNCEFIDIYGRNKNEPFTLILKNARLITVAPCEAPRKGQVQVTFLSSLRGSKRLDDYEILRAQPID